MSVLCDACGHPAAWHTEAHGCRHADTMPGGHVACDCPALTIPCDVCAGYGCADCND